MSETASSGFAIYTAGLAKNFGSFKAVAGIDLRVPQGSVFGFLGPNGSGKTTTIRMILGLANISAGDVQLLGYRVPEELSKALPKVGALVEGPAFYPYLSGRDNLIRYDSADLHADPMTRSERVDAALARVGLTQAAGKKVHAYSLGMKQRLGIANALLQPRELLVLDEPTNGLDPQGTREVRNLIRSLASDGITIFVSSHLLAEIEQICTHLAVMSRGEIVAQGSIEELSAGHAKVLRIISTKPDSAAALLLTLGITAFIDGNSLTAELTDQHPAAETIIDALVRANVPVRSFTVQAPTLEDRFVSLTGEGFEVAQ